MADTMSVSFRLECRVHEAAEGLWSAGSPGLDVWSQGATREEAKQALQEAIELFIESCLERDTLDGVLRDCGFRLVPSGVRIPSNAEEIRVEKLQGDDDELLGEGFPLDITIPAYQAALLLDGGGKHADAC
jgi:predicted RNase H-like HicB family nuclease